MIKQGWQNDRGIWQWNTEINAVQAGMELGASKEYIGVKADTSAINFFVGGRFLKLGGKDYYVGIEIDLLALGLTAGYDPEESEGEIGASIGAGIKLKFKKKDVDEAKIISNVDSCIN